MSRFIYSACLSSYCNEAKGIIWRIGKCDLQVCVAYNRKLNKMAGILYSCKDQNENRYSDLINVTV